jgi:hypothetical protein
MVYAMHLLSKINIHQMMSVIIILFFIINYLMTIEMKP